MAVVDVLAVMDQDMTRAATPRASRKPVFLFLMEGQKALIRPVYNLNHAILLAKHTRWHEQRDFRVDAICAAEIGKVCLYCEMVAEDKKLTAGNTYYVPVYVYQVVDTKSGQKVTVKDPDTQQEKPVSGFRMLELSAFGKVASILKTLRSQFRDEPEHDITAYDFSIEQSGVGQKKDFVVLPKAPKPMHPKIAAATPTLAAVRKAILEARPPAIADSGVGEVDADEMVIDGEMPEEGAEDAIPEF